MVLGMGKHYQIRLSEILSVGLSADFSIKTWCMISFGPATLSNPRDMMSPSEKWFALHFLITTLPSAFSWVTPDST